MDSKQFLQIGGIILILVGVLGFFLIGPTSEQSIFGEAWWFDNAENWAHLVLGIVALLVLYAFPEFLHKPIVVLVGIIGLLVGLYSLFGETTLLGANLENPADTALHVIVGAWALWAGMKGQG